MSEIKTLKIFISSPSDVRPERLIAERVVERLGREFAYHFHIEPVLWEREPLVASQHFQESITPPRETDIVVVILWSRLGVPLPIEKFPGPITNNRVTGTEWEFEDALKATRERKLPDLLMYRKKASVIGSLDDEEAVKQQLAQRRLVEEFVKRWFIDQDAQSFTAAFREFTEASVFEELLETHLRELLRKRLEKREDDLMSAGIRWHQGSPYRGLLSFELEHAPVFFGRTLARNELRELLDRQVKRGLAFVMVVGASGSGKSSLIKAGLLPDLQLRGMIGQVALVRHAIFRPSEGEGDLVSKLAAAIMSATALPELEQVEYDLTRLRKLLAEAPTQIELPIRQGIAIAGRGANLTTIGEARLAIVVDQLEEIFTREGVNDAEREAFVTALDALARSGLVWVIATMRSDFFDRLEKLPRLLALSAGEARYVLAAPQPAEVAQIIRQPAREAGLSFAVEEGRGISLDEVIRIAAERDPNALPLLSFLLDQLWLRRTSSGELTFEAYRDLGGLEGALGRRAEQVFAALPAEVQSALPVLLRCLVTVSQGPNAKISSRSSALALFPEGTPARALIQAFLDPQARLLVAEDEAEHASSRLERERTIEEANFQTTHGAQVRVAHEALFSHWPRARDQIAADSRDLELLGRLEQEAKRWRGSAKKHSESLLLAKGLPLAEAVDLVKRWSSNVPAVVDEFVRQSRRAARRRSQRLLTAFAGAALSLPVLICALWIAMVWHGVREVEREMPFVAIPQGCFLMGTPVGEVGRFNHEPEHKVCVPAFEMGKYDVTQDEWRLVMVENPNPARYKGPRKPVEMVSWNDARSFAWRMSIFGGHKYRLPSEAEWEYATRANASPKTTWFWGNKIELGCAYANLRDLTYKSLHFDVDEAIINCADGYDYTSPVGSFKPNAFGLYDMIGNLFQWTEDCFGDYAKAPTSGAAAEAQNCSSRVVRGGSWNSRPRFTRSGSRDTYPPDNRNDVVGFRLAR